MPHQIVGKHLGRNTGQRNALRRTLITQLFQHERITTTRAKAEAIRGEAEHMITQAKRSLVHADPNRQIHIRRLLAGRLDGKEIVKKVFDVLAPRYAERPGGYTRMYQLGPRKGDAAEMVILELVDRPSGDEDKPQGPVSNVTRGARGLFSRLRGGNQQQAADQKPEAESDAEEPTEE
jgi:large subunit ribosomal protein L17